MGSCADRVSFIPAGNANRPGYPMDPQSITIHETANTALGANAEMHRRFVHDGGGPEGVSFHYVVDDHESIQLLPDTENAWHAGDGRDGAGNRTSIAIEKCVNRDADPNETERRLVELVRCLMDTHGIDASHVYQHNHWSGKDCPHIMRSAGGNLWQAFKTSLVVPSPARYFRETQQYVGGAFLAYFDAHGGVPVFGYPISGVLQETEGNWSGDVQYFERARMEDHGAAGVQLGLVGGEAYRAKYDR